MPLLPSRFSALLSGVVLVWPTLMAPATSPTAQKPSLVNESVAVQKQHKRDEKAEKLIKEMIKAYASLKSFKAKVVSHSNLNGEKKEGMGELKLQKPYFALDREGTLPPYLIANDRVVRNLFPVPGKTINYVEFKPDPKGQNIQGELYICLFFGQPILDSFLYRDATRRYVGTERVDGKLCHIVELSKTTRKRVLRLYIGEDRLIHRTLNRSEFKDGFKSMVDNILSNVVLNKKWPRSDFQ